ncbi:MAG: primase C-terminal domain-containing protein [Bacilli bacterium]
MFALNQTPASAQPKSEPVLPMNNNFTHVFELGKTNGKYFSRNTYIEANPEIEQIEISKYTAQDNNISYYRSYFDYTTKELDESLFRGDLVLDFDDEESFYKVQSDVFRVFQRLTTKRKGYGLAIPGSMIRAYFSGKKGIHLVIPWQVFGYEWHNRLFLVHKHIAKELAKSCRFDTLDLKIYERRRLLRIPYTKHVGTGLYKVAMNLATLVNPKNEQLIRNLAKNPQHGLDIQYQKPYEVSDAKEFFESMDKEINNTYKNNFSKDSAEQNLDFEPPCITDIFEMGPVDGSRNKVAAILSSYLSRRGLSEEDAYDKILEWNNGSVKESELKPTFRSGYNGRHVYGCNTMKEHTECPATCKKDCSFYKED